MNVHAARAPAVAWTTLVVAAVAAAQQPPYAAGPGAGPGGSTSQRFTFAVVGDYGWDGPGEQAVAAAVGAMAPDLLLTVGDNNYPFGERTTLDPNIGQHYREFISPYLGAYGPGATVNRFFPSLGNHDLYDAQGLPYLGKPSGPPLLDWLELPGNERYYEHLRGQVHFFALNSDLSEPDGVLPGSAQGHWLRQRLLNSPAQLQVVYFHHAPHSSGPHGASAWMQWPFEEWGADLVLSGHDHVFERHGVGGLPYVVNGLGGAPIYPFVAVQPTSQVRFNLGLGFVHARVVGRRIELAFHSGGVVVDTCTVVPYVATTASETLVELGSTWRYLDDGTDAGTAWVQPGFDDAAWPQGPAVLGYGNGGEATVVGYGGDPLQKHVTTYFRHAFAVADPERFERLDLALLRDDGIVVHLNGREVHRGNLPWGPVAYDTLAGYPVEAPVFSPACVTQIDPAALVPGTNVLAVEVHQVLPTSSDLTFDLELTGHVR